MEKILFLKEPLVSSWHWHATVFSLFPENHNVWSWIYDNYIQLKSTVIKDDDTQTIFLDFFPDLLELRLCPFIETYYMQRSLLESLNIDIIEYILRDIDLGNYIIAVFNKNAIFNDEGKSFPHEMFVYGYNTDKEILYCAEYDIGGYKYFKVSFEVARKAYCGVSLEDAEYIGNSKVINSVKAKNFDNVFQVDVKFIRESIQKYLSAERFVNKEDWNNNKYQKKWIHTYGIEVYDSMVGNLEKENHMYDFRQFHVLFEHKVLMRKRIGYLMENEHMRMDKQLLSSLDDIVLHSEKIRNLYIKYGVSKNQELIDRVIKSMKELKQAEHEALSKVVLQMTALE